MKPLLPNDLRPARPRPAVVLLVDDDADFRGLVRTAVEDSDAAATLPGGVDVREAPHGEAALRFLRRQGEFADAPRPTLIYLDMEMPRLDGLATLRAIKADERLRDIPTVMFSGLDDDATVRRALASGANSYTVKPADAERLLDLIDAGAAFWLLVHRPAPPAPPATPPAAAAA